MQASADTVAMKDAAANQIQEWQKNGYETIAVICRDETEAKEVSDLLQDTPNLMSYTPERSQFGEGIMVLPVVYTKGLEFDAVLLWNPTKEQYPQDNGHIKLLYVAATRALHELTVLYQDILTDIIVTEVPKEKHLEACQCILIIITLCLTVQLYCQMNRSYITFGEVIQIQILLQCISSLVKTFTLLGILTAYGFAVI